MKRRAGEGAKQQGGNERTHDELSTKSRDFGSPEFASAGGRTRGIMHGWISE